MIFPFALCMLPLLILIVCCFLFNKDISGAAAIRAVLAGFLPVIPIMAVQLVVFPSFRELDSRLITRLLSALILNGLIEEGIKFMCLLALAPKNKPLSVYAASGAIAGLTLGALESAMYFIVGFERILLRLATAALIHTLCAILCALCIASFKTGKKQVTPLVIAVLIHGVYNFFAGFIGVFWLFSIAAILFAAIECRVRYVKLLEG